MPAAKPVPAAQSDKALARLVDEIQDKLNDVSESVDMIGNAAEKAPLQKTMAELRKRFQAARQETDGKLAHKQFAALKKDVHQACEDGNRASIVDAMRGSWLSTRDQVQGMLAEAMVEVGRIEPLALRAPLQKQQLALRAEMDRALQAKVLDKGLDALRALFDKTDALLQQIRGANEISASLRTGYLPLVTRVRTQILKVAAERSRKTLLAEIEFVEADVQKALAKGDAKVIKAAAVPQLQHLERVAARVAAVSPALDRELARIAQRVKGRADAVALLQRLKALVQAKAGDWPGGAGVADIERSLARFEADVAKLAAQADKLPAAATAKP